MVVGRLDLVIHRFYFAVYSVILNLHLILNHAEYQKTNIIQMKAIILISSIFYILGVKISNKIDLFKHANPVEKIITNKITSTQPAKSVYFNEKIQLKSETDSIKGGVSDEDLQKCK